MDQNKEATKVLLTELLTKGMGVALDLGRMSIPNDRNFKQYERSVKIEFRNLINNGCRLLDESAGPSVPA